MAVSDALLRSVLLHVSVWLCGEGEDTVSSRCPEQTLAGGALPREGLPPVLPGCPYDLAAATWPQTWRVAEPALRAVVATRPFYPEGRRRSSTISWT